MLRGRFGGFAEEKEVGCKRDYEKEIAIAKKKLELTSSLYDRLLDYLLDGDMPDNREDTRALFAFFGELRIRQILVQKLIDMLTDEYEKHG